MCASFLRHTGLVVILIGTLGAACFGDTLLVPEQYQTIQDAIDHAVSGQDEVVIADADVPYTGKGNRDLDFKLKAITVRSASGDPALCIIDCGGSAGDPHSGFYFHSEETAASVVEGLTITGGYAAGSGGGVLCTGGSSPTLRNCIISRNYAGSSGGGLHCSQSNPTLINCTIDRNQAGSGGGMDSSGNPTLDGCRITGNQATYSGGGIRCTAGSPTLLNCTISDNQAYAPNVYSSYGGGIYCSGGLTLIDCIITGNLSRDGGGVYANGNPTFVNCEITRNSAYESGGALWSYNYNGAPPALTNCTIAENWACSAGGGIYSDGALALANCAIVDNISGVAGGGIWHYCNYSVYYMTLMNCTLRGNWASNTGGGISCGGVRGPTLTNCILWDDTPQEIVDNCSPPAVVTYCDVQGGWTGDSNIDVDPQFAFPGDLRLMPSSPCIDVGNNSAVPPDTYDLDGDKDTDEPLPYDLGGGPRFSGDPATVDMGAYEFNPAGPAIALSLPEIRFVAPEGGENPEDQVLSVRNCGVGTLDWEISGQPAWLTISPDAGQSDGAMNEAVLSVDTAGLPTGSYTATLQVSDDMASNTPREVIVRLIVGRVLDVPTLEYPTIQAAIDAAEAGDFVEIADGSYTDEGNRDLDFGGKAITVRSASDNPALCVIDCGGDEQNHHRGFFFDSMERADSVVRGLTISNGFVDDYGAGVLCQCSSPRLVNCVITGNSTTSSGGGIYCESSFLTLEECTITSNHAARNGGGMYCSNDGARLSGCTIAGNQAGPTGGGHGGGVALGGSRARFTDCTVGPDNTAVGSGGGIHLSGADPTFTNCAINGNSAGWDFDDKGGGGGVCCCRDASTFTRCTISGNRASGGGGGVHAFSSNVKLLACTIRENLGGDYWGGGVRCVNGSPAIVNCEIAANRACGGGGIVVHCSSAALTDCTICGNSAEGPDSRGGGVLLSFYGELHLGKAIPSTVTISEEDPPLEAVLTSCSISQNSAAWGGGIWGDGGNGDTLINCAISDNQATKYGGGIYTFHGAPRAPSYVNCTIAHNTAGLVGGAVWYASAPWDGGGDIFTNCTFVANGPGPAIGCCGWLWETTLEIKNCILWSQNNEIWKCEDDHTTVEVTFSDVQGGWPGVGNIDADPLFVDPDGPDDNPWTWWDNDYHLQAGSPCLDAGNNEEVQVPFDLDGWPRFVDDPREDTGAGTPPIVDMGAYERMPEGDCNGNTIPDVCDIDCEAMAPDETACDEWTDCGQKADCNENDIPDECETCHGDCNHNEVDDCCDLHEGASPDCNGNNLPDECEIEGCIGADCNDNGVPDECDVPPLGDFSPDCNANGTPDECEPECEDDCNGNGTRDCCEIYADPSQDCNENAVPDECEPECWDDCNDNEIDDCCEIYAGTSEDCQGDGIPDECQGGCPCPGWVEQFPVGDLDGAVKAMTAWDPDGAGPQAPVLVVGGDFTHARGLQVNYIARWDGSQWQPLGSGMNGPVYALTVWNGELVVGGSFTTPATRIARWDGVWHPLGSGIGSIYQCVYALVVYEGELIAGGNFTTPANRIARWDGAWHPLGSGVANGEVRALTVHEGDVVAGGTFSAPANYIARWNETNGWRALDPSLDGYVFALTVYGEELIAGGSFWYYGECPCIGRWNDESGWQALGSGMGGDFPEVDALTVYNGDLIAGGYFTTAGGMANCNHIARAHWDDAAQAWVWQPLGSGIDEYGWVQALTVYPESGFEPHPPALFAGGAFMSSGGVSAGNIARWNDPVAPPEIVTPPGDQVVEACGTAEFSVEADGYGPLEYQWYRSSGTALVDGPTGYGSVISGATTPTLTIADARGADAGQYRVRVWHCGVAVSAAVTLTVTPVFAGDLDIDCDVDVDDFDIFAACLLGPGVEYPAGCADADFDADGDVDLADFAEFEVGFGAGT
ncbi:MAG TPA: choice-of-anchor Q domain-containing protein [Phycisphaerae bacterium]|nr:choice-of-anchor Q domain-containing protein [Phycisphaerae bacterium]HNU45912.1 choice-of-anchor Q domain-containing protein [Phycisphaerae bacterium]